MAEERTWSPRQLEILEAGEENIEVLAAAGAGKTSVLVEKIYRIISDPEGTDVDRLLVMTFTRAAAAEMKERLATRLTDALEENPGNRRLLRQQMLLYGAQICTIDSFCQSVLKEFYSSVDVDPAYRIGDEAEIKLLTKDTVSEIVEEMYLNEDKDFLDFVSCYTSVRDDSSIESNITKLANCAMAHPDPDGWLEELYERNSPWDVDELLRSDELSAIVQHVQKLLAGIYNDAINAANKAKLYGFDLYYNAIMDEALIIDDVAKAQDYEKMFIRFGENFKKFPSNPSNSKDYDKGLKEECKKLRDQYKKKYDDIKKKYFSMDADQILETRNMGAKAAQTLIAVTRRYLKRLIAKKLDRNVLGFEDVAHYALDILTEKSEDGRLLPSEKALILRKRYDRIFVDEYQDSNEIQEELVNAIAGPAGEKPYTFMVGDVKQSIYKFRMAKPELFIKRYELYKSNPKEGKVIVLDSNYRSLAKILESTNSVFCRSMIGEVGGITYDDDASLKPGTDAQKNDNSKKTKVVVVEGDTKREMEEAAGIVKEIRERRGSYAGIAVLLRTSVQIGDYRRVFEDAGIPVSASETTGFLKTFEIMTMIDYMKIIDNPAHDIPFVGALASPIGGLTNDELARIRIEEGMEKLWCEAARSYSQSGSDPEIRGKLTRFFNAYDTIRSMNLCRDLSECIERIYELTGFMTFCRALPNGEVRAANLNLLIDYAYAYEETSYSGLFSFMRYIEQLKSTEQDLDESEVTEGLEAVTITTIHRSKGLEYPVVIVGGLNKLLMELDTRDNVIKSSEYGVCATAIDPEKRVKIQTLFRSIAVNKMTLDMKGEELRLLYVAMTRAKEELIMIGCVKDFIKEKEEKFREWEETARLTSSGNPYLYSYIAGARTYLDFVMPAALDDTENFEIKLIELDHPAEAGDDAEGAVEGKGAEAAETGKDAGESAGFETVGKSKEELLKYYREAVCERETDATREIQALLSFKYPYEEFSKIPAKLSVSDIKKKYYEEYQSFDTSKENDLDTQKKYYEEYQSVDTSGVNDLDTKKKYYEVAAAKKETMTGKDAQEKTGKITGAAYGTLLHEIMRFIPFNLTIEGIDAYIDELEKRGIIGAKEKETIARSDIEGIILSPIFSRLRSAWEKGTLRREQPFITGIPACEIDRELYGNSDVLVPVQGIIDVLFEEDGKVCILDYKTDKKTEEQLREVYKPQLDLYMRASVAALGKPEGKKIIYSFNLQRAFEV